MSWLKLDAEKMWRKTRHRVDAPGADVLVEIGRRENGKKVVTGDVPGADVLVEIDAEKCFRKTRHSLTSQVLMFG